jgi:hypothetical protein
LIDDFRLTIGKTQGETNQSEIDNRNSEIAQHSQRPQPIPFRYNGLVSDTKPFRLTESVKAAG